MTCLFPLDFVALSSFDYLQQLSSQILSGSPSSSTQNSKQFGSRQGSLATTLKNRSTSFSCSIEREVTDTITTAKAIKYIVFMVDM